MLNNFIVLELNKMIIIYKCNLVKKKVKYVRNFNTLTLLFLILIADYFSLNGFTDFHFRVEFISI